MDRENSLNLALKLLIETTHQRPDRSSGPNLDWAGLERKYGLAFYADLVYLTTRLEFGFEEARMHWLNILEHRSGLTDALGREVGLQTAVYDYFHYAVAEGKSLLSAQITAFQETEKNTMIDSATGLLNHRFLEKILIREIEAAKRFGDPFALLMFKVRLPGECQKKNEALSGEPVFVELAGLLARNFRAVDHVFRFGPDEFAVILPRADKTLASKVIQRHLRAVSDHSFSLDVECDQAGGLDLFIGMASYPADSLSPGELTELARQYAFAG